MIKHEYELGPLWPMITEISRQKAKERIAGVFRALCNWIEPRLADN